MCKMRISMVGARASLKHLKLCCYCFWCWWPNSWLSQCKVIPPVCRSAPKNCGLREVWYSTLTPPGNLELSNTSLGWTFPVPAMLVATPGKWAFKWALLCLCQSIQILSTKLWWRANSGATAESKVHICPNGNNNHLIIFPIRAKETKVM